MAERQPSSRTCFLCGRDNPVGLKMVWENHPEDGEIRGTVTVPEHFNGYPGIVHGGIVASILDETAGRAVLLEGEPDDLMVTAKMEVTYRRPTPTSTPLLVVGHVVGRQDKRAETRGEIRLPDGTVSARATVWLARPPRGILAGWEAERQYFMVDP
jgi:uncharacterized protein (TIGR00369 family)